MCKIKLTQSVENIQDKSYLWFHQPETTVLYVPLQVLLVHILLHNFSHVYILFSNLPFHLNMSTLPYPV